MNSTLERLKALRASSIQFQEHITKLAGSAHPASYYHAQSSYSSFPLDNNPADQHDLNSRLLTDFTERNRHIIESQLKREQSANLLANVLDSVTDYDEDMLDAQISKINLTGLNNINSLVKTINITPGNIASSRDKPKRAARPESPPIAIEDIDDEFQDRVMEYIDDCYKHIIKVLKVYFILADGKNYRLPSKTEIATIKTTLEGHINIPNGQDMDITGGTPLYYLSVDESSRIKMGFGYYKKPGKTGLILQDDDTDELFVIDFKCPMFRKINNLDIAKYIQDADCELI